MKRRVRYAIEFTREADTHLAALEARDRTAVLDALDGQLGYQPAVETRNRKRLRPNPVAPWELRIGHLRVYFDVEQEPRAVVRIQAVGIKDRSSVWIGGEEVELT